MAQTVRIRGDRELRAAIDRAVARLRDMRTANAKVASVVTSIARARAPRRTGWLASTGRSTVGPGYGGVVFTADYSAPVAARNPWIPVSVKGSENVWLPIIEGQVAQIAQRIERESL